MTDETAAVLQEIAALLRRQVEQHDAMAQRAEEARLRFAERPGLVSTVSGGMRHEEMDKRREEMQVRAEQYRDEERQFKQRLLAELERHNHLIESLLERLGQGPKLI